MNAYTLYFGHSQPDRPYRDSVGRPLAGAVLTFWQSGTTEHAPVYTDDTLGTEHETPITANDNGIFPEIYLSPLLVYRVKLEDAHGRLVWDVDPYAVPESPSIVQVFTANGTFNVPSGIDHIDHLLVVAGGGGGSGGGGGAGGVVYLRNVPVTPESAITVTVGAGGQAPTFFTGPGENGSDSSFGDITATGGGGGGGGLANIWTGRDGGSGGGGGWDTQNHTAVGTGIPGQGHDGGLAFAVPDPDRSGGGGGGAGGVGGDGSSAGAGNGGIGRDFSSIFGSDLGESGWFAGGGAGVPRNGGVNGIGGMGGGGDSGQHGAPNTGGGGGGGGGHGGSGIVALRFGGSATLFLPPIYQPICDGRVLPGAEIKFFADDEIAATYADSELGAPLSHPIRSDAGGYFPPIYLGAEGYAVQLKDAAGNVIAGPADNPVPTITALDPASVVEGEDEFTLTVTGTGFVPSSVVRWGSEGLSTAFVSATVLEATVPAAKVTAEGYALISVFNPVPLGGLSNYLKFSITETPNPVPVIDSLDPSSVVAESGAFTLTVNGSSFVPDSVVRWNGEARVTTFIDSTELEAAILAGDVSEVGTASITVFNPAPGGGESNAATLTVTEADPDYATVVLGDTPVGYWRLGETTGTTASDSSGNGHHGTYEGNPTLGVTGLIDDPNLAVQLDGSGDYVSIPSSTAFDIVENFSVELWFTYTSGTAEFARLLSRVQDANNGFNLAWATGNAASSTLVIRARRNGTNHFRQTNMSFTRGVKYHLVVVFENGTITTYVNGSAVATSAGGGGSVQGTTALRIGYGTDANYHAGVVDEVAWYGYGLSSAQVAEHYSIGVGS